jgi:hypothetical protein
MAETVSEDPALVFVQSSDTLWTIASTRTGSASAFLTSVLPAGVRSSAAELLVGVRDHEGA